jgi:hypothetical protein
MIFIPSFNPDRILPGSTNYRLRHDNSGPVLHQIFSFDYEIRTVNPKSVGIYPRELKTLSDAFEKIVDNQDDQIRFIFGERQYKFEIQQQNEDENTLIYLKDNDGRIWAKFSEDDRQAISDRISSLNQKPTACKKLDSFLIEKRPLIIIYES